jgi:glycerol-3-phosphate dehydrogenase subunit B
MHYDLIVIGMGLSGLMAAKTATEMGRKVLIIGKGMGSLCLFSNTIDLLSPIPETIKMRDHISQWIKDHPEHPYAKVGMENIEEALECFLSTFPPPYSFQTVGSGNCLIPTGAGTFRPTYLIPATMSAGTFLKKGNGLIVGFKGFKDFYALYVANQLQCRGITLPLPDLSQQEISATALSRLMERESFRAGIGTEIRKELRDENRVGLPALLGIHDPIKVKKDLEERIGIEIFEIPILPPSIPGMRIFNRFKEWLIRKGVTFLQGYSIAKATLKGKRCEGIGVLRPPVIASYSSDYYILATGRFIGGGLKADRETVLEPIFNLSIYQPKSREDWFGNNFFSALPHPIHRAGVLTDSCFRPIDERGDHVLENVWVAGSILAHHHGLEEKSREGVEIATGYMAAKHALATSI